MTRFLAIDQLSGYIRQLDSLVCSSMCDHITIKCIQSSSSSPQFVSCPVRLLDELPLSHPCHSIVLQAFQSFHEQYEGCSAKTLIFFLTRFYEYFQPFCEEKNLLFQKKIFEHLEEILHQSFLVAERLFAQTFTIDVDLLHRLCRNQSLYADGLHQAYLHFTSFQPHLTHAELCDRFTDLHSLTRVKFLQEKCLFLPGILLPATDITPGYRRTVLIDGYLLEDYRHLGYKNPLKLKPTNAQSSWIRLIRSIVDEYSIEMILCSGTVDDRIKDHLSCIGNLPISTLRALGENSILHYLTDVNEDEHIRLFNYLPVPDDPSLIMIEQGATLLHYVPLETLIDLKHERLQHCLARLRHILRANLYLNGSGEFESRLDRYWSDQQDVLGVEEQIALDGFRHCLQAFVEALANRGDLFEKNLIDDCASKVEAWKVSLDLVKILLQIDCVVQIVPNDELSDL